jgi:hypothetical protein
MKHQVFAILLIVISNLSITAQNCHQLTNGTYKMKYDDVNSKTHKLKIKNDICKIYYENKTERFKIIRLSECSFRLESFEKIDETKLTEIQRLLYRQEHYYEITEVSGNIYIFTCRVNLHIECGKGKFEKI